MNDESNEKDFLEEPSLEDFLAEEELDLKEIRRKKRRTNFIRIGAVFLAVGLLMNGLAVWVNVINLPALEFVKTSLKLSKKESIKIAKEAVVTVQGEDSKGTGFNIRKDGLILTNSHVIKNMNPITIYFSSGMVFRGEVIKDSPDLDIAIIKIEGENLPVLNLQQNQVWKENEHVFVIGNPLSFTQIANEGQIEGLTYVNERSTPVIKISAPVYRGNSGSPVLNKNNEVIGVVFATTVPKLKNGEKASGLVVPIEQVNKLLE